MMFLLIIIAVLIILCIGSAFIELFGFLKEESVIAKLSYAWGLGVGLIALQLFFYSICNISWNLFSILSFWFILIAIYLCTKHSVKIKKIKFKLSWLEIIFTGLIILLLFFTGIESILRPVYAWDAWDNWIFRPKVFYLHNNLNLDYVRYTNDEYPLIIPLMGTFGYYVMDGINDTYVLFLFFMFYLALGGLFFSFIKKQLGTKQALIWTFLLLSLQNIIRHGGRYEVGQADLALGYYFFAGLLLLINYMKTQNPKTLLLLSILLGISSQIKDEGIPYFLFINAFLFVSIIIRKKIRYLFLLFPSFLILLPWEIYKKVYHYPMSMILTNGIHPQFAKSIPITVAMGREFINFQNWSLLWIVFFMSLFICFKKLGKVKLLLSLFFLQWVSYYIVFIFTPIDPVGRVNGVIDKLYLHLAPIAVLIVTLLFYEQLKTIKKIRWKKYFL